MDFITHFASGALLSRSGIGPQYGKAAAFAVIGGAIFPDIDIFLLFFNRLFAYKHHRGLTHSLVGLLIFPLLIALPIYLLSKYKKYWQLVGFFSLGMLVHISLDLFGSWGTQVLYPFTNKRYSLDIISFIDYYFTLIILIFLLISVRFKSKGIKHARIGLLILACYFSLCITCHFVALEKFKGALQDNAVRYTKISTIPSFGDGPFAWTGVAENKIGIYRSSKFFLFSSPIIIKEYKKEPSNKYTKIASQSEELKLYLWYAEYPLIKTINYSDKHIIRIWDLRYREPDQNFESFFGIQITMNNNGKILSISGFH
jgi:inner membrane protein